MKSKKLVSVLLAVLFLLVCGIIFGTNEKPEEEGSWTETSSMTATESVEETETGIPETVSAKPETREETVAAGVIYVYVCGHVAEEKVVVLTEGARVYEAVEEAGGFSEDAYTSALNLAQVLRDGDKVYVPGEGDEKPEETAGITAAVNAGEQETASAGKDKAETETALININTASREELMSLPDIGEVRADRIIAYRNENGKFEDTGAITNVDGISDSIYEKIKALICAE